MGSATGGACCADEDEAGVATEERRRWGTCIGGDDGETGATRRRRAAAAPPRRDAAEKLLTLRDCIEAAVVWSAFERRQTESVSVSRRKEGKIESKARIERLRSVSSDSFSFVRSPPRPPPPPLLRSLSFSASWWMLSIL